MRDPTPDMLDSIQGGGVGTWIEAGEGWLHAHEAEEGWKRMIDAALKQ
jgi:hypothetical protein